MKKSMMLLVCAALAVGVFGCKKKDDPAKKATDAAKNVVDKATK